MEMISRLMAKVLGKPFSVEEVLEIGREVLRTELAFNRAAGIDRSADRLPEFFRVEKLLPTGLVFDVPEHEIDQVHAVLPDAGERG